MRIVYSRAEALRGMIVYAAGDTAAALLLGRFAWTRLAGMMLLGGTVYALEIPNVFRWIDARVPPDGRLRSALMRTSLALAYFNPIWIARHIWWIRFVSGEGTAIDRALFATAAASFLGNIPIAIAGNFVIQNVIAPRLRFTASAVFSGLLAVYYAASAVWFA